jgi:hypothetical protein
MLHSNPNFNEFQNIHGILCSDEEKFSFNIWSPAEKVLPLIINKNASSLFDIPTGKYKKGGELDLWSNAKTVVQSESAKVLPGYFSVSVEVATYVPEGFC